MDSVIYGFNEFSMGEDPMGPCAMIFIGGCNLDCPHCQNKGIARREGEPIPFAAVSGYVMGHKDFLKGVVVTGGEPLANGVTLAIMDALKRKGLRIILHTNGTSKTRFGEVVKKRPALISVGRGRRRRRT